MTSDGAHKPTSTPNQGSKHHELKVNNTGQEEANTIILRSSMDSSPKLKLDSFDSDP